MTMRKTLVFLAPAHQEPQRDRQVETVGIFFQVGRGEFAKRIGAGVHYLL
jgi:hypothetical protein